MENWRYFPEKSINLESFFTVKLVDDSCTILLQQVYLNRNFVADF
jgi:hypothetical protein